MKEVNGKTNSWIRERETLEGGLLNTADLSWICTVLEDTAASPFVYQELSVPCKHNVQELDEELHGISMPPFHSCKYRVITC